MSLLRNLVFVHDIEEIAAPGHEMAIECCVDPGFDTRWFRPEVRSDYDWQQSTPILVNSAVHLVAAPIWTAKVKGPVFTPEIEAAASGFCRL